MTAKNSLSLSLSKKKQKNKKKPEAELTTSVLKKDPKEELNSLVKRHFLGHHRKYTLKETSCSAIGLILN